MTFEEETGVPLSGTLLIIGATLTWCIAMALNAPGFGAPLGKQIQWLVATAFIGTIIVFGMSYIVFKVYDL